MSPYSVRILFKAFHYMCAYLCVASYITYITLILLLYIYTLVCHLILTHVIERNTVNSFMATAATGPAWPLSCRTNKHRDKSHMIAVPSRDPDTMTLYAGLDDKHVTASVCPYRHCFMDSCRLTYSQTVTTYDKMSTLKTGMHIMAAKGSWK